jgi:phosphoglycerol transferase
MVRAQDLTVDSEPRPPRRRGHRRRSLIAGAILAALLSSLSVTLVTHLWSLPLHVPFQYTQSPSDDQQDATLEMMLIKNIRETGWFNTNPKLNAPFAQQWAEWPMGGDLLAYTVKKAMVDATGDVPLTFNLFWLLTFPLTALAAFPALRALRSSWSTALVGAVLFSLAPYHFRNGAAHENLAFYVGVPVTVVICAKVLGPDSALPSLAALRHRRAWWDLRWLLLGCVLIGVTGIYYLAFLLSLLAICAVVSALAQRRPGRLGIAALFGGVGLATSVLANLPTLLFRLQHAKNLLNVPDRQLGVSEAYPLRLVELLSPVTAHRFGPFAALADRLYEPGREGLGTAQLGLAAAIGFVCAIVTVLVRAVRSADRRGWSLEARLGVVMVGALLLGTKGGLSRALELVGLGGVRAWNRIAIVIAFAAIAVFARLLDRLYVAVRARRRRVPRIGWALFLVGVAVLGVLDQAAPAAMPHPKATEQLWHDDGAFVASMERRLPRNAMVFQLPVVDFPDHSAIEQMSAYDLIKEGYLHSKTLRWSTGGIRGRDGEWQWPASALPMRDLLRGVAAMGFSAVMLDRYGFSDHADSQLHQLEGLLGAPIATRGHRLVAWDLRPATAALLGHLDAAGRHALVQQMLDAPRLYLATDADPLTNRGDPHEICASGQLTIVNPGRHVVRRILRITMHQRLSAAQHGRVAIDARSVAFTAGSRGRAIPVEVRPGNTHFEIAVDTPGVRCRSVPPALLPTVSAELADHSGAPTS